MSAEVEAAFPSHDGPDPGECQYAVSDKAPFDDTTPYWEEKLSLCKIVASRPNGASLTELLRCLHGRNGFEPGGAEYQRARRFLSQHPNFFRVRASDGLVTASPTLELLDLINGGIIQRPTENPSTADSAFCQQVLQTVDEINDHGRDLLERNLNEYVEKINDLRIVLEADDEMTAPEYLTLPYKTRFNDEGRINKQWSVMSSCIEKAGEWYDNAALLTLTTDPKKFDSLYDAIDNINKSWNRLMSWLSSSSRLDYRPDYLKVLEFTEKGFPHIHAIVFLEDHSTTANGMPWLESKNAISNYWSKYQGEIVDVQPLAWEDDLGDDYDANAGWVRWSEDGDHGGQLGDGGDGGKQTAGAYLGKYLSAIYGGIKGMQGPEVMTDGGEVVDEVGEKYEDKAATWKIAMYWASGRKIRTESRDLRQAVEDEVDEDDEDRATVAEAIREGGYTFAGAYPRDRIPLEVRQNSVPIDAIASGIEEPEYEPGGGDRREPTRRERIKRRYPARVHPLLEGLMGGEP